MAQLAVPTNTAPVTNTEEVRKLVKAEIDRRPPVVKLTAANLSIVP